jgi:hypothetical protein
MAFPSATWEQEGKSQSSREIFKIIEFSRNLIMLVIDSKWVSLFAIASDDLFLKRQFSGNE